MRNKGLKPTGSPFVDTKYGLNLCTKARLLEKDLSLLVTHGNGQHLNLPAFVRFGRTAMHVDFPLKMAQMF